MPYGDIIVIGALAAFILLRYRAMLGTTSEHDQTPNNKPAPLAEFERVIQLPAARARAAGDEKKDDLAGKYGALAETFVAMRGIDREFAPDEFLTGARTAFEMVITAFTKRDRDTLKMLLSDEMMKSFELSLTDADAANRLADTTLVAITKAEITNAKLSGNLATLTVDFASEQIHLIRDKDGNILEGDASHVEVVEDQWVFTRTLTSSDPSWTIVET
jgi:predicted lipid-binding transport protein (Tim44 family)